MSDTQLALAAQYGFPVVVALVVFLYQAVMARMPAAQRLQVEKTVSQVVQSVEQAQALVPGQVKKDYAVKLIQSLLSKTGLKVSPELLDTLIEQAVFALNKSQTAQATTVLHVVPK